MGRETVEKQIVHDWSTESLEEKARWFQSLSIEERMNLLCEFTELILSINPNIVEQRPYAESTSGRVRVVTKT